jgi:small subunit ribosomal protein S4
MNSRYIGPKAKINRRFKQSIFSINNKYFERKPYYPGIHGPRLRRRETNYSLELNEKQKLRFMYGLTESKLRSYFKKAKKKSKNSSWNIGDILMIMLEMRIDNVIYKAGFSKTIQSARQIVSHKHITLNKKKINIPSINCNKNDLIQVSWKKDQKSKKLIKNIIKENSNRITPSWMIIDRELLTIKVSRSPNTNDIDPIINKQLIIEYYSR